MNKFVASLVLNGRSLVHFAYEETNRSQYLWTIPQFAPCGGRRLRMVHLSSVLPIEARGSYDLTVVTVVQDDLFNKLMKPYDFWGGWLFAKKKKIESKCCLEGWTFGF